MERLRNDPAAMALLSRISNEIGFDYVRVYEQDGNTVRLRPKVPFAEWDNPHFTASTPGSIAAHYYNFLHECCPLPEDDDLRAGQIGQIVEYLQREGKSGANQMALAVAGMGEAFSDNAAVQELASALMKQLAQYQEPGRDDVRRQKPQREKSQER